MTEYKQKSTEEKKYSIKEILVDSPNLPTFTKEEVSQVISDLDGNWPTTRWHLEFSENRSDITYQEIGRTKLYLLPPENNKKNKCP